MSIDKQLSIPAPSPSDATELATAPPPAPAAPARPDLPHARKLDLGSPCGAACCGGACATGTKN